MTKFSVVLLMVVCLFQMGCSLASSAANRSYSAFNVGEYQESLRLIERAISTYEYSDYDKADLLFLKAKNYTKLEQSANAKEVFLHIIKLYPDSEASYKAKYLLTTLELVDN